MNVIANAGMISSLQDAPMAKTIYFANKAAESPFYQTAMNGIKEGWLKK